MSFCSNCGQSVSEGVKFCTHCGNPIATTVSAKNVPVRSNVAIGVRDIRQINLEEAERVYDYFMAKEDEYNELMYYQSEQARISNKPPKKWYWMSLAGFEVIMALFIGGHLLGGIISTAATVFLFILWRGRYNKKVEAFDNQLAKNAAHIEEICDELAEYYENYENCPIGPEYTFPSQLKLLVDCIVSGRADSFKEAINILVTDGQLRQMQANTERAADNAGAAATFAALNFFFK